RVGFKAFDHSAALWKRKFCRSSIDELQQIPAFGSMELTVVLVSQAAENLLGRAKVKVSRQLKPHRRPMLLTVVVVQGGDACSSGSALLHQSGEPAVSDNAFGRCTHVVKQGSWLPHDRRIRASV
ncbi:MAG: hypothetical protein EBT56_16310, partial [Betaproteobacteria bacterium]|nr:hypothetical protein [Betaproteobacteria bacterium]